MTAAKFVETPVRLACALALTMPLAVAPALALVPDQSVTNESLELLCQRTALSQAEIDSLQKSELFVDLLEFTLEYCPEVAALLTDGATAVTTNGAPVPDGN